MQTIDITQIPGDAVVLLSGCSPYVLTVIDGDTVNDFFALDLSPELLDRVNVQAFN